MAISPWFVCSQTTLPKVYSTTEITSLEAPEMDGFINDKIWNNVPWGSNFIEVNPDENTAPTEQTKFKILYDQKYLYIALLALDASPKHITKRLSRRDGFEAVSYTHLTLPTTYSV